MRLSWYSTSNQQLTVLNQTTSYGKVQPSRSIRADKSYRGRGPKNAVNPMVGSKSKELSLLMNTDAQIASLTRTEKIHIGKNLTRGLGTGMNPEIGRKARRNKRRSAGASRC